jgi:hypothetical protein
LRVLKTFGHQKTDENAGFLLLEFFILLLTPDSWLLTSRIPARRRTSRVQSPYRARGDFKGRSPLASIHRRRHHVHFIADNQGPRLLAQKVEGLELLFPEIEAGWVATGRHGCWAYLFDFARVIADAIRAKPACSVTLPLGNTAYTVRRKEVKSLIPGVLSPEARNPVS